MTLETPSTRIKIDTSFAVLICLMLIFCRKRIVLISLFSSLCHESGHLIAMYFFGDTPERVTVSAFGMSIDRKNGILSYKSEALIAMGGIIVNVIISAVCFLVYAFCAKDIFAQIAIVNVFIALINMVPIGMLDFARAINSLLLMKQDMKKTQKICDTLSLVSLVFFLLFSIIYNVFIKVNLSLIAVTVYLLTSYRNGVRI